MDRIKNSIKEIREKDWYKGQIEHIEVLDEKEPEYGEADLGPDLERYLSEKNIKLYKHQAKSIDLIKDGKDVIITTPTASGKTLAFNLPVFEKMKQDPEARALYIYPTKALSNDQLDTLRRMEEELEVEVQPATYDGDTPKHRRPTIRKESRIVLTNPYGLHHYLPWHQKWRKFFEKIEFLVLDEVHNYRGIFGSNVAFVIRRLLRTCRKYGSDPQLILSSATIANPKELSNKLADKDFEVVSEDGSTSGKKYFIFWNSSRNPENSPHVQTTRLLTHSVREGLQTLCFTVSRKMTELISKWSSEQTTRNIRAYRAGYMPEERREIEQGLREGRIDGVASTNALELGIDIGGLDTVLISGYPGTVISTWQQAGRAGRGKGVSSAFLIGFEDPLDQFFMKHPKKFFEKSHEHAVVDLTNPNISMGHLICAASEFPVKEEEKLYQNYEDELKSLEEEGVLHETPAGFVYSGTGRPAESVKLDNIGDDTIKVVSDGDVLETMDVSQSYREAHEGAVLMHQGETYIIDEIDLDEKIARASKENVDYHTEALSETDLTVLEERKTKKEEEMRVCHGTVDVSEHYWAYRIKKFDRVVGVEPIDLPPLNFKTESTWIEVPSEILEEVESKGLDPDGGLHAIEHAMIAMTPFHSMCDRWDIGGVSSPYHSDVESPAIFVYDSYEGGIGISEKCYSLIRDLLKTTYNLIEDCDCEEGCPSCIYSPKCGSENEPLDKQAALEILSSLIMVDRGGNRN